MLRFLTSGESHGKGLAVTIEGLPANLPIDPEQIRVQMQKRMKGSGAGGRMKIEKDQVEIYTGVRFGKTIGSPVTMLINNLDFDNWGERMSSEEQSEEIKHLARVTNPRPGHADLAGVQKYAFDDARNVLERASARETTARVAAGAIFKQLLQYFGITIASHTLQIGAIRLEKTDYTFAQVQQSFDDDAETRCIDPDTAMKMKAAIIEATKKKDTLGGIIEIWATGVPVGLGSYVHFDRKIDGQIAQALMSIQSVKAVEIGEGVSAAGLHGSEVHDPIMADPQLQYTRQTNRAGGIEGGVTNGMPVIARVYHKPISTLYNPLQTVDIASGKASAATVERSDICIVPRGAIVSESMLAYVLAQSFLEMFGNGAIEDIKRSYEGYQKRLVS